MTAECHTPRRQGHGAVGHKSKMEREGRHQGKMRETNDTHEGKGHGRKRDGHGGGG